MSETAMNAARMMALLPEEEQNFAYEFIKKLVKAWDPDFTKLTIFDRITIWKARREYARGETVSHKDINWD